jgi:hypothetical protein
MTLDSRNVINPSTDVELVLDDFITVIITLLDTMRLTVSLTAALLGFVSLVAASNVIDLDTSNFEKYVGGSKGALVELYVYHFGISTRADM